MKQQLYGILAALVLSLSVAAQTLPKKDISQYVWDLSSIFPSDKAWNEELKKVQDKLKTIGNYKSTMGNSSKDLVKAMDDIYDLRSKAAQLTLYGMLKSDVDIKDGIAASMATVGANMEREVETAISFLPFEIIKIGKPRLQQWMKTEPGLKRHKRRINRILLEAPYTSDLKSETLIQTMKGWPTVSADGFYALIESELKWPRYINSEGKEIEINHGNYISARRSVDAKDRINIPKTFLGFFGNYEHLLGFLYTKRIEADLAIAQQKKFSDAIEALWKLRDGAPAGTYQAILRTIDKNKAVLDRYGKVLGKIINIEKPGYQDFYSLPRSYTKTYTIDESFDICLKAMEPVGKDFVNKAISVLQQPIMHLVPSPVKRSFYANQSPIGGIPSYTMMTYTGSFSNLRTIAGLVGSKVRSVSYLKGTYPDTRDDPPIFGNGMLYVGEMLLTDYLLSQAKTKEEKIFYLHNELYRLWQYSFYEVISLELDVAVQQLIINKTPPDGKKISEIYLSLLRKYYGDVDEVFAKEWMISDVRYLSFEGQFWIGSMASACFIHDMIKRGDTGGFKAMWGLIGRTDTDLSYGMLKSIGIDITSSNTYQAMYDRMNYLLDQVEKLQ